MAWRTTFSRVRFLGKFRQIFLHIIQNLSLGGVLDGWINEGSAHIFTRKRRDRESKNSSNITLGESRSIEEKDLGFLQIDGSAWGLRESVENFFDSTRFLNARVPHEEGIIHNWWDKGELLCRVNPFKSEQWREFLNKHLKPSSMRMNRKGESRSPWQMLREGEKVSEGEPFTRI